MTSLKPCPFCGGEARFHDYGARAAAIARRERIPLVAMVECPRCGAGTSFNDGTPPTEDRARELWNRRTERTCRWVWVESWRDDEAGRECDYANWALDCGCWDGWDRELHDFDDPCEPPREWNFCPRCGARVVWR